ncbi:MAG: hypothetical protein IKJ16_04570 [Agathobacter sp.]|nr:hypothetical protein [Agathobacter sp.]
MKVSLEQNNPNIQTEKIAVSQGMKDTAKTSGAISGVSVDLFATGMIMMLIKVCPKQHRI